MLFVSVIVVTGPGN